MHTGRVSGWRGYVVGCAMGALAIGCDAQAATDYRGESLLTLTGSVEFPAGHAEGPLVPALLFQSVEGEALHILDVEVRGEFPANFQFDVYETPPSAVLSPSQGPDEPSSTWAFITAVSPDHGGVLPYATLMTSSAAAPCYAPGCNSCEEIGRCEFESMWCANNGECYREVRVCPRLDTPREDCTVESSEGDVRLKHSRYDNFAGYSQNYIVAYLADDLAADSYAAKLLDAPSGLKRGYHLIAVRELTEAELAEARACSREADAAALAQVNEAHGTEYTYDEIATPGCWAHDCPEGFHCPPNESRICDELPKAELDALQQSLNQLSEQAVRERLCEDSRWKRTHVPNPARERISVRLARDSNPFGLRDPIGEPTAVDIAE